MWCLWGGRLLGVTKLVSLIYNFPHPSIVGKSRWVQCLPRQSWCPGDSGWRGGFSGGDRAQLVTAGGGHCKVGRSQLTWPTCERTVGTKGRSLHRPSSATGTCSPGCPREEQVFRVSGLRLTAPSLYLVLNALLLYILVITISSSLKHIILRSCAYLAFGLMRSVLYCDGVGWKAQQHSLGRVQDEGGVPAGMREAPVKEGWDSHQKLPSWRLVSV